MNAACALCGKFLQSSDEVSTTTCGHVFHQPCVLQWLNSSPMCPQCKSSASAATTQPIYLNFSSHCLAINGNLKNRTVNVQHPLDMNNMTVKLLLEIVQVASGIQNECAQEYLTQIGKLRIELYELSRKLRSKAVEAEGLLESLQVKEKEIHRLKESSKGHRQAYRMQTAMKKRQNKLIEELLAKCSELETSKRKLELLSEKRENEIKMQGQQDKSIEELIIKCLQLKHLKASLQLEKRDHEIATLRKATAVKEEPTPSIELESENKIIKSLLNRYKKQEQ